MIEEDKKKIALALIDTFIEAGKVSIELRKAGLKKEIKEDGTAVTNGDLEVNKILIKKISLLTPNIPIISEETSDNKDVIDLKNFWLIDPIDGTNDYINNREEFTLNAALIINRKPALGIINAPDKNRLFYSYAKTKCFELSNNIKINLLNIKRKDYKTIRAITYSNDLDSKISKFHEELKVTDYKKMKSSLKFCVVASGEFDLYVAEARACEWDIAAGHAIIEHSGGTVKDFDGNEILYGKPDFRNTSLIVKGSTFYNG
jgi:3'(2'), 5'-bisphosphate nucleotidase